MSKNKKIIFLITGITVSGLFLASLFAQSSGSQDKKNRSQRMKDTFTKYQEDFPEVRRTNKNPKGKGKKYKFGDLPLETSEDVIQASNYDWASGLSALPVDESRVIFIGKVLSATAFISDDDSTVFSEFNIKIIDLLKKSTNVTFSDENIIDAERIGGIVRYPSGKRVLSMVPGQRMPRKNRTYLFFIGKNSLLDFPTEAENDFYILTAYELRNKKVFPLDNPGGGKHPIAIKFKEKAESVLLEQLKAAITK